MKKLYKAKFVFFSTLSIAGVSVSADSFTLRPGEDSLIGCLGHRFNGYVVEILENKIGVEMGMSNCSALASCIESLEGYSLNHKDPNADNIYFRFDVPRSRVSTINVSSNYHKNCSEKTNISNPDVNIGWTEIYEPALFMAETIATNDDWSAQLYVDPSATFAKAGLGDVITAEAYKTYDTIPGITATATGWETKIAGSQKGDIAAYGIPVNLQKIGFKNVSDWFVDSHDSLERNTAPWLVDFAKFDSESNSWKEFIRAGARVGSKLPVEYSVASTESMPTGLIFSSSYLIFQKNTSMGFLHQPAATYAAKLENRNDCTFNADRKGVANCNMTVASIDLIFNPMKSMPQPPIIHNVVEIEDRSGRSLWDVQLIDQNNLRGEIIRVDIDQTTRTFYFNGEPSGVMGTDRATRIPLTLEPIR